MAKGLALALLAAAASSGVAQARAALPQVPPPGSPERAEAVAAELASGRRALAGGQLVPALQHYTQALALAPDSIQALNGIAVSYDRLGRFDVSRTYYEIALGIDPAAPELLNNYGYSLYLQGEFRQALRFLRLAVAAGDAEVQHKALHTLAALQTAEAPAAPLAPLPVVAPESPRAEIVRTSAHEVRLVLADGAGQLEAQAPRLVLVALPDVAAADRAVPAAAPPAVPAWIQAIVDLANVAPTAAADWPDALRSALPTGAPQGPLDARWDAHQILDFVPAAPHCGADGKSLANWGLPQPVAARPARKFDQPFTSDDARLNRFAERLHASPRKAALQQLQALTERRA